MDVYCPNMTIFDPSPNEERMVATIANMRQPSAESLGQHLDLLSWLMRHGCPPQGLEKSFSRYLTWNYQSIYPSIYLSINLSTSIYRHLNVCVYNCIYIYIYIWAQLVCPKINHNPTHEIVTWQHGLCPQQMTSVLPYAAVPLHIQENDVRSTISKVAWFLSGAYEHAQCEIYDNWYLKSKTMTNFKGQQSPDSV